MRQVACPIAVHPDGAPVRLVAFEHPLAGLQLVKGGIRNGERAEAAAARELYEETGLESRAALFLGTSDDIQENAIWSFSLCRVVAPVRAEWRHLCADDGGHVFRCFWHPLETPMTGFDPVFQRAADWIKDAL